MRMSRKVDVKAAKKLIVKMSGKFFDSFSCSFASTHTPLERAPSAHAAAAAALCFMCERKTDENKQNIVKFCHEALFASFSFPP